MKSKLALFVLTLVAISLSSCRFFSKPQEQHKKVLIAKTFDLPEINTEDTSAVNNYGAKSVSGATAKYWGQVFKHCMASLLLKNKEADYLGPSNALGLGTVTTENLDATLRVVDSTTFSKDELNKILKPGVPTSCQYIFSSDVDVQALVSAKISVKGDDDLSLGLSTAIKNQKKVNFDVESWQKDELIVGALNDALEDSTNINKVRFKKDLLKNGNIVMIRLIRVKGFNATIELKNDISAALKAKLSSTVTANLGSGEGSVNVSVVNSRTIKLKCSDDFYVFGKFVQFSEVEQ